ncbi:Plasma kallikrein [Camponotus floridanus]|uniref:Plasma kallikrein n=1 Tax=Camponotus floridanus TaxID=104421 RepID=E2AD41_CAMFO|nr:trypsin 3A1 [Camponotus floridanus]EFN68635.1 Plasma kallikrein [Camponotus floridanus]
MDGYARMEYMLALSLCLSCCVYALPHVVLENNIRNFPASNAQVHYNITNAEIVDHPTIDEVSYIDFDPAPISSSKRPNVCKDCTCGLRRNSRIVGGNVTNIYNYPWLVSMTKMGNFYCAGTVITRKHLLTAAHCLRGYDIKTIKLVLMDSDRPSISNNAIVRRIKSATIHENFDAHSFNNDIAIIEMDEPVSIDNFVRAACLPEDRTIDYTGAIATAVGWGRTGENKPISNELRKVNLPILSQEECDQSGFPKNRITENMFCSGYLDGKRDACFGDSGGPLHVKGVHGQLEVIGIVSWGRGCARPNFPGIYTKLTNYMEWLKDHLDNECICPPPHQQN